MLGGPLLALPSFVKHLISKKNKIIRDEFILSLHTFFMYLHDE